MFFFVLNMQLPSQILKIFKNQCFDKLQGQIAEIRARKYCTRSLQMFPDWCFAQNQERWE